MLRLQNINYLDVVLSKHSGKFLAGISNFHCYASNNKDDFQKMMVPMETKKDWKKIQIMAKEHRGELKNDSVNEVVSMARTFRYRPNMMNWKKRMTLPHTYAVKDNVDFKIGNQGSPSHGGKYNRNREWGKRDNTENRYSFNSKNTHQNQQDNYEEYERDEMGRYIKKSEKKFDRENKKPDQKFDKKRDNVKSMKMFDRVRNDMKSEKTSQNKRDNKYKNYKRDRNDDNYNKRDSNYDNNKNNNLEPNQLSIGEDSTHGTYYYEFMKLIEKQKQPPFIFSAAQGRHSYEIDLILEKLTKKLNEAKRDGRSFSGLGINACLADLLISNNISKPTRVQIESIPELLRGRNAIIESATGSGKTLAFLLPMIQNLSKHSCSNLIIVPTRELATQIYKEFILYGVNKDMISRHVSGVEEEHDKKLRHALKDSKILIGTPKKLLEIVESNSSYFKQVRQIVMDEVDKLLPVKRGISTHKQKGFSKIKPTEKLLAMLRFFRKRMQFVATSATISNYLVEELQDVGFGNNPAIIKLIPKEYKHGKIPENIKHLFTVIPETDEFSKIRIIGRLFELSKEKSILVFIHRDESVEKCVDEFKDIGLVAKALYKELLLPAPTMYENFMKTFEEGNVQVVVSTEETVRGIDFPFLNNVYLTFVPDSPEKYVHLAGRVGRLGKPAQVVTLIGDSDAVSDKKHLKRRLFLLGVKGRNLKLST